MKAKEKYNSGKFYVLENDYHEEKEYEKNVRFLETAFLNLKNKLTLEQTRKIIEIMSE